MKEIREKEGQPVSILALNFINKLFSCLNTVTLLTIFLK